MDVNKPKLVAYALTGWLFVEIIAFILVVQFLGTLAAIALGVGTTLLGLADIKRLIVYLRSRIANPRAPGKARLLDGTLEAVSCILLILPGFASDLVGLALKAPSVRASLANRIRNNSDRRSGPPIVDLAPNEWKSLSDRRRRRRPAS
jgi:UPF0716 protein FxsA